MSDETIVAHTRDDEYRQAMLEARPRSIIAVPVKVGDQVRAVLSCARGEGRDPFTGADLLFLDEAAKRAALALENTQLYAEAQRANRQKDEFIATLSHELRTRPARWWRPTRSVSSRSCGTCSRTRSSSRLPAGGCSSWPTLSVTSCRSSCAIPGSGSRPSSCRTCSTGFGRPTCHRAGRTPDSGSGPALHSESRRVLEPPRPFASL